MLLYATLIPKVYRVKPYVSYVRHTRLQWQNDVVPFNLINAPARVKMVLLQCTNFNDQSQNVEANDVFFDALEESIEDDSLIEWIILTK